MDVLEEFRSAMADSLVADPPCAVPEGADWAQHLPGCTCGSYRIIYDKARAKYADATHALPCARCAAEAGSQLSKAHCFARAMRITAKAILKDLWCEAKRLHEDA